jgi:hypothetical protein
MIRIKLLRLDLNEKNAFLSCVRQGIAIHHPNEFLKINIYNVKTDYISALLYK